jgi:serine/threonine-protein kinase
MMGVVYEAEDSVLGRNVAVKTIEIAFDVSAAAREEFELRFFTEARVAAKLAHPGIVVCHDVGKDPETGKLFIVFEHLKGRTLAERVAGSRLGWREGIAIVAKVARAIQHAHEHGVIHRDLKPANVMLLDAGAGTRPTASPEEPAIKIMDFGVAKMESARVHLTAAGQSFGSPLYMSPEQALGHYSDARSDIFSVGSILCTVLLGRPWFQAPNIPKILGRVVHDDAPVISELVHGLPASLDRVIARALAKHVDGRYAHAADLADDIEDILAGQEPRHVSGWTVSSLALGGKHDEDPLLAELTTRVSAATVVEVDPVEIDPASVRTGTVNVLAGLIDDAPAATATPAAPSAGAKRAARSWVVPGLVAALLVVATLATGAFLAWSHRSAPDTATVAAATAAPETTAVRTAAPATEAPTEAPPTDAPVATTAPTAGAKAQVAAVATAAPVAPTATSTHEPAQAQVLVRVAHPLENGRLVVWIDGVLVFETKLKAEVAKKIVAIKLREGRLEKTLNLEPGRHEFKVEMTWDDKRKVETTVAEVNTDTTGVLDVNLARVTNDLSLAWSVAAKTASP